MKTAILVSVVLVLSMAGAGVSSGGEVNSEDARPPRPDYRPGMGPRQGQQGQWWRNERMGGATTRPVSPDEVAEIEAFMQKHSPKRYEKFKNELPEKRREGLMQFLAVRHRMLQDLKQNDPEIYEIRIVRMAIEDEIFDIGWQLNHDSPDNSDELTKKLKQQVRALMKSGIEEKRLRVKQWKKRVEEESAAIEKDESNMDRIVDANVTDMLNSDKFPGLMNMMPGAGGPMGPGMGQGQGQGRGGMRPERDRPGRGPFAAPAPTKPAEE